MISSLFENLINNITLKIINIYKLILKKIILVLKKKVPIFSL